MSEHMLADWNTERALRRLIHTGKRELGLDDGAYRALLERVTGKTTSALMGTAELRAVADEMRRLGFAHVLGRKMPDDPQQRLIVTLWSELGRRGKVRSRTRQALDKFIKRQTGIDKLEWLTPETSNQVIEALKAWRDR